MDFLRNLAINLKATGPAAVVCVWFICITALGILGGPNSSFALPILFFAGLTIISALLNTTPGE
jgi:hypothetical protein